MTIEEVAAAAGRACFAAPGEDWPVCRVSVEGWVAVSEAYLRIRKDPIGSGKFARGIYFCGAEIVPGDK